MASFMDTLPPNLQPLYPERLSIWEMAPGDTTREMVQLLNQGSMAIVTPTKVGYIVMTVDQGGLEKKFAMKGRPKSKPGVVLCSSLDQLDQMAEMDDKIRSLYRECWKDDILLGCILPWKESSADAFIPKDGSSGMVQDARRTSCFVIRYGVPSERIASTLWENHKKLCFASSANPSGKGNRGRMEFVGEDIIAQADHLVFGDPYVECQQPKKSIESRWEQGVMVSMVDDNGVLKNAPPTIIRHGLALEQIREKLLHVYGTYEDKHGAYH